ncbi:hypothetical protein GOODEAATRI_016903 [Goodea atripinnis]|uniref:Uncharacterized protein n=1 Tax=Goodea atripinnis TaxID=208336 RepID=A0ABV0MJJ5_9TELE
MNPELQEPQFAGILSLVFCVAGRLRGRERMAFRGCLEVGLFQEPRFYSGPNSSGCRVAPLILFSSSRAGDAKQINQLEELCHIVLPAVAVLLMTPRAVLVPVALASPAAGHLGWMMPVVIAVLLPRVASARMSTSGRLPLDRFGEGAIKLLERLHMELPHVVPL